MTEEKQINDLADYVFLPRSSDSLVQSHSIPEGRFAGSLLEVVRRRIKAPVEEGGFGGNPNFGVYEFNGGLAGSTQFLSLLLDEELKPYGARTADFADLNTPELLNAIKDKHYSDSRSLVLRGTRQGYVRNTPIFNELAQHIDSLETPVVISGLRVEVFPQDEKGYGLKIVPTDDFEIHKDDRFNAKYNGWNFNETDEKGLPIGLNKNKGRRTWFAGNDPLSRLAVNGNLSADSDGNDLAFSYGDGRVAVVSAL